MKYDDFELKTGETPVSVFPCRIMTQRQPMVEIPAEVVLIQAEARQAIRLKSLQQWGRVLKERGSTGKWPVA